MNKCKNKVKYCKQKFQNFWKNKFLINWKVEFKHIFSENKSFKNIHINEKIKYFRQKPFKKSANMDFKISLIISKRSAIILYFEFLEN